ncbi:MAG: adenylate/guanylate cyclase domain-containing protein [Alphaproteobacteria bacterium]|nr:MAG: adenylate/guanylate cyclase domain-containing protein [Alphaproteobacteria bacterium]TMJ38569.1 MAG: adenylate/guanylate cyclase domain-containing protein [Alphaproteobacteria bacterium]
MPGRSSMHQHRFNLAQESQWPGAAGEAWQPGALPQVTSAVTLFADIVGYTEHCETLGPEEAYLLLCDFYQRTSHATTMHNAAIVDHFGDTLLAVWKANVPLAAQAFRALRCAFTILREMECWSEWRRRSQLDAVRVGIGIHAGPVMLGRLAGRNGGTSVFGDTVNIASRLERQTRRFGADIVISEDLFRLVAEVAGDTAILGLFPRTVCVNLTGRAKPLDVRPAILGRAS